MLVLTEANIWIAYAWVTSVSHYDGVSRVQTNTLTEITIIAGLLKK